MEVVGYIIGILLFLVRRKKYRSKAIGGRVAGVFIIAVCAAINYFPDNGIVYCKMDTVDVIKFMLMTMLWSQISKLT